MRQEAGIASDVWETIEHLTRVGCSIQFVWVPGHSDIDGNEEANAAAKAGASMPQGTTKIDISAARRMAWKKGREKWVNLYLSEVVRSRNSGRGLTAWHSETGPTSHSALVGLGEAERRMFHQLKTGNFTSTGEFLHRIGKKDSSNCPACGVNQDVRHLLLECSDARADYLRRELWGPWPTPKDIFKDGKKLIMYMRDVSGRLCLPEYRL